MIWCEPPSELPPFGHDMAPMPLLVLSVIDAAPMLTPLKVRLHKIASGPLI